MMLLHCDMVYILVSCHCSDVHPRSLMTRKERQPNDDFLWLELEVAGWMFEARTMKRRQSLMTCYSVVESEETVIKGE